MTPDYAWTPDAVALLREMWTDPALTKGDMATRLGCTRNAVAGKAHRLGGFPPRPALTKRQRVVAALREAGQAPKRVRTLHEPVVLPPQPIAAEPVSVRHGRGCLFPTWQSKDTAYWAAIRDGVVLECGAALARGGAVYCARHVRTATVARVL